MKKFLHKAKICGKSYRKHEKPPINSGNRFIFSKRAPHEDTGTFCACERALLAVPAVSALRMTVREPGGYHRCNPTMQSAWRVIGEGR